MTRIDRRALFTSGAAAALLAATGTSLAAKPQPGGNLRLALPRADRHLDRVAHRAVLDGLTEIGPDGLLRGELATGWHSTGGGRIWRFELRQGVAFHDGRSFEAADAVASLQGRGLLQEGVAAVTATGAHEIEITLDRPNPHLPYVLAGSEFLITPGGKVASALDQLCGTGCYRVERAQEGRHLRALRQVDHYKEGQAGWVDSFEVIVIPDERVRAEALLEGFVDVAALPRAEMLQKQVGLRFFPTQEDVALAARQAVGMPQKIGTQSPLDDGRIAERWWMS